MPAAMKARTQSSPRGGGSARIRAAAKCWWWRRGRGDDAAGRGLLLLVPAAEQRESERGLHMACGRGGVGPGSRTVDAAMARCKWLDWSFTSAGSFDHRYRIAHLRRRPITPLLQTQLALLLTERLDQLFLLCAQALWQQHLKMDVQGLRGRSAVPPASLHSRSLRADRPSACRAALLTRPARPTSVSRPTRRATPP